MTTGVILGPQYRDEHEELKKDFLIIEMARQCPVGFADDILIVHPSGTPRHEFMGRASHTYLKAGGDKAITIGGPARAILALCRERDANNA